jgi:CubicO group peptidase (beta-lactamase class C family)
MSMRVLRVVLATAAVLVIGSGAARAQVTSILGTQLGGALPRLPLQPLSGDTRALIVRELLALADPRDAGGAIGVKRAGGVIFTTHCGNANFHPHRIIDRDTGFDVTALAQQITAFCIALLVQDGRLRLDALVKDYLPNIRGEELKVYHLVYNTANLYAYRSSFGLLTSPIGYRSTNERVAEHIAYWSSPSGHGIRWQENESSSVLLAQIIHAVSGQTLRQFARHRIFGPLGMTRTDFNDDVFDHPIAHRARAYERRFGENYINLRDCRVVGDGGLVSTITDFLRWEDVLAGRHELGSGARLTLPGGRRVSLLEAMTTPGSLDAGIQSGQSTGYAFGLVIGSDGGHRLISGGGLWAGWKSHFIRFTDEDLSVVVMTNNSTPADLAQTCRRVADLVRHDPQTRGE